MDGDAGDRRAPDHPAAALLDAVADALGPWMHRCVERVAHEQLGEVPEMLTAQARASVEEARPAVLGELAELLAADVDEQRSNPLSVLRGAVRVPTAVLAAHGVAPRRRDAFREQAFPDDLYDLSPATWSDVDPSLHEPGLVWGAWKAKTVLDRRRQEGRR